MLKYVKLAPYMPSPTRCKPHITQEQRDLAAGKPPTPVPHHCKPWLDARSIGWTLYYPFLSAITLRGTADGKVEADNIEKLQRETDQPDIISQFAPGHFGLSTGMAFKTPPGIMSLITPPEEPQPNLTLIPGLIETDWYPRQVFLVFQMLPPRVEVKLAYRTPIARMIPVPRLESSQAQEMSDEEKVQWEEEREAYKLAVAESPTAWQDSMGQTFTNEYKIHSRKMRLKVSKQNDRTGSPPKESLS